MSALASSLLFVGVGAVFTALAIPMLRRWVRPNPLYGVRLAATFADEHVWYEANADAGRWLLALGIALATGGAVLPWVLPLRAALGVLLGLLIVGIATGAVRSARLANRLLRERRAASAEPARPLAR